MKLITYATCIIGIALSIATQANALTSLQLNTQIQQITNHYLQQNSKQHGFSAVEVSVLLPGEQQSRNFVAGTIKKGGNFATTNMLVQYGSITKMFTASLILKLIKKGIIHSNSTLGTLFPQKFNPSNFDSWPIAWQSVTIRQLLLMTSGIGGYIINPKIGKAINVNFNYSLNDLVNLVAKNQQHDGCQLSQGCFKAGTHWYYSNTNYLLLGLVVEKYYNDSFPKIMRNKVLRPFQQQGNQVYYYPRYPEKIQADLLHGYFEYSTAVRKNISIPGLFVGKDIFQIPLYTIRSAGALTGTTSALAQLIRSYFDGKAINTKILFANKNIINPATAKAITNKNECKNFCYAIGNELKYEKGYGVVWEYEGGTYGFSTYYNWYPKSNIIIIISQNSASDTSNLDKPMHQILKQVKQYLVSPEKLPQ